VTDAEAHADDDRAKKESAEARNIGDTLVYQTEKTLKDLGDKVPEATKTDVEEAVAEAKKALEGDDTDAIKSASEKLQQAAYKLAEIVYQSEQPEGDTSAEGDASADSPQDEEVADFEVVDEDKK
jgi:molecular chaperone DnaK